MVLIITFYPVRFVDSKQQCIQFVLPISAEVWIWFHHVISDLQELSGLWHVRTGLNIILMRTVTSTVLESRILSHDMTSF